MNNRLGGALDRALADARVRLEPELETRTHELSDAAATALAFAAEALDRAESLTGGLRALVDATALYAERVGLFFARDGRLLESKTLQTALGIPAQ